MQLSRCLILSTGELKSGGHHRESILADTVEAIIGAIYLDSSDLNLLKDIVLKWYTPYLDHIEPTDQLKDPKSRLQEYLQARKNLSCLRGCRYSGDAPHQHFKVECLVDGLSKFMVRVKSSFCRAGSSGGNFKVIGAITCMSMHSDQINPDSNETKIQTI